MSQNSLSRVTLQRTYGHLNTMVHKKLLSIHAHTTGDYTSDSLLS